MVDIGGTGPQLCKNSQWGEYVYIYVYIHIFMHTYSYRICAALRSSVLTALRADAYALDSLNRFEPLGHMEQHQCSFQTA